MGTDDPIELADAIRVLRSQLAQARVEGESEKIKFRLAPVEMEFLVETKREGGGDAGIRFYVVSLGAKGTLSSTNSHRLKLTLQPIDAATGRDAEISHEQQEPPK
jgi:hypothetical protein